MKSHDSPLISATTSNKLTYKPIQWVANFGEIKAVFHEPTFLTRSALLNLPVIIQEPYRSPIMMFTLNSTYQENTPLIKQIEAVESFLSNLSLVKTYGFILANASSYSDLLKDFSMNAANQALKEFLDAISILFSKPIRYRFDSNIIGEKISNSRKVEMYNELIEQLPVLKSLSCDLTNYDIRFILINECLQARGKKEKANILSEDSCQQQGAVVLAVSTSKYLGSMMRYRLDKYKLPSRIFLGPTSMDHELAFIMCEIAGVKPGDIVCDPFVGTGSILVSAAFYGCITVGGDLNIRVLRGRSDAENFSKNFSQYDLPQPIILHHDVNIITWQSLCLDAILCDPPYSIRAGSRKGRAAEVIHQETPIDGDEKGTYDASLPSTRSWNYNKFNTASQHQDTADIFLSVLRFAAWTLKLGGHLVFWIPYLVHEFTPDDIPAHTDFVCLYHLPQQLTTLYGRRMCVLKRVSTEGIARQPFYNRPPSHANFSEKIRFHKSAY